MKIKFNKPKYVLPIIILPFMCLFFYVYKSMAKEEVVTENHVGLQEDISQVSGDVKNSGIADKLEAFKNQYRETDRLTAIENINIDPSPIDGNDQGFLHDEAYERYLEENKDVRRTPSSNDRYQDSYMQNNRNVTQEDEALANALNVLTGATKASNTTDKNSHNNQPYEYSTTPPQAQEPDQMDVFKQQMAFVDSMSKINDPDYQAELEREKLIAKAEKEMADMPQLAVEKANRTPETFNTIRAEEDESFIKAIVDENITGYAGSRIRLRLLEDVKVGGHLVKRGSYIYAEITSFTGQRVGLTIQSIIKDNKIFPVRLEVYDLDGMAGLYVPASQFREFSKELGGSSLQGVNIQSNAQNQNEFIMSTVERMFSSTSAAIAKVIRKNKAKVKYNTFIYLINPKELQDLQKSY